MDQVIQFFNDVVWFFDTGLVDMLNQLVVYVGKLMFYSALNTKLYFLKISYEIAQEVLADFNVTALIETAFSALDADTSAIASFMKVPDLIKNVVAAYTTRFVISIMGW